ncbi:MAG: hypothetical protein JNK64_12080 [Myxococcales bacterium]|nr:hypothetical protein [Myxococcales bacterium]
MTNRTILSRVTFALAAATVLALTGCADDDPVADAASHMCACERVNEPGTDVAACEAEVEGVLATSADCVACINANAGSAANAQTCATLSATCTAACGFGDG